METIFLPRDRPFAARLRLARAQTAGHVRRALWNGLALATAEALALALALVLAGAARRAIVGGEMVIGWSAAVVPVYLVIAYVARLLPGWGLGAVEELRRSVWSLLGTFALVAAGLWLSQTNATAASVASRLTLGIAGVLSLGLVPYVRTRVKSVLIRAEAWGVEAVIYGAGQAGAQVVRQLQEERGIGYTPVAVFDDDPERWGDYLDLVPIVGSTDRVAPEAAVAFLALPEAEATRQVDLLEGPLACYRTVVIVPSLIDGPSLWVKPRDIAGVLGLEVSATLTRPLPQIVKRITDLIVVLVLAPLWVPLMGLLAALVRLEDGGGALYGQVRIGRHGRTFRALKLRTMVTDADAALQRAIDADPALRTEWETYYKLEQDPRITRVGALLRKTSLDEIPQLVNVLRGEMSLVGPRPLPRYHHDDLPERVRSLRERVRPGITGLWQVSGRSDSGNVGMERWDPYYVRNWSLWIDVVILVRTVRVVLRGSGAY